MGFLSSVVSHVKERKVGYIIAILAVLVGSLLAVIWRAWLFEILQIIGEIIPKQVLAAIIVLLLIFLLTSMLLTLYFQQKAAPRFIRKHTVKWDKDCLPHCPVCEAELAHVVNPLSGVPDGSFFRCITCKHDYRLINEETGEPITLKEAQASLFSTPLPAKARALAEVEKEPPKPADPPPSSKTPEAKAEQETPPAPKPQLKDRFTVLWDENRTAFCPLCEGRLIPTITRRIGNMWVGDLKCVRCQQIFLLRKDDGRHITLEDAKQALDDEAKTDPPQEPPSNAVEVEKPSELEDLLGVRLPKPTADTSPKPPKEPEPKTESPKNEEDESDEATRQILIFLGQPQHQTNIYVSDMATSLRLPYLVVESRVKKLAEKGYVNLHLDHIKNLVCSLTNEGKKFLNEPVYKVPHPSGSDVLDIENITILRLLADPNADPSEEWLSEALRMHIVKVKEHLATLIERGYVSANRFDLYYGPIYELTRKGRQFLIQNNLI